MRLRTRVEQRRVANARLRRNVGLALSLDPPSRRVVCPGRKRSDRVTDAVRPLPPPPGESGSVSVGSATAAADAGRAGALSGSAQAAGGLTCHGSLSAHPKRARGWLPSPRRSTTLGLDRG
jgi:hypothetical protein